MTEAHEEFEHMRGQIFEALDVLQSKGLPPTEAIPELIKFLAALSIKANGAAVTLQGMHNLVNQLDCLILPARGRA